MAINPEAELSKIHPDNYRELVGALEKDDDWKKVADFLVIRFGLRSFCQKEISSLSKAVSPAETFINELIRIQCRIDTLETILRKCKLHDALLAISGSEPMQILRQPTANLRQHKLNIKIGEPLELEFNVTGIPWPKFQWFKDDQPLQNQTDSVLLYDRFKPTMRGNYTCVATQEDPLANVNQIQSQAVTVEPLSMPCKLLREPDKYIQLCEGSPVFIQLQVTAYPKPHFQWVFQNQVLDNETEPVLFIKQANRRNSGEYRCFISNGISEIIVKINVIVYEENVFEVYKGTVSNKVALLIGNCDYDHFQTLKAPTNDVAVIARTLQSLGFITICLHNLNLKEILIAADLLAGLVSNDSYAFFYYAGHGFEMGDRFIIPSDCPAISSYKKSDTVPESMILNKVLEKNPALFIFLLDMCLKLPDKSKNEAIFNELLHPHAFQSNRNLIRGYSTTSHSASYETNENRNGIYVNTLKNHLDKDLPVLTILGRVNAEISVKCPDQMPSIFHNTAQDFFLNNSCQVSVGEVDELYSSLCITKEEHSVGNARIYLRGYKQVFQNALEIAICNAGRVEIVNVNFPVEEITENGTLTLRVFHLQLLEDGKLFINLKIDEKPFIITKHFKIADVFVDI